MKKSFLLIVMLSALANQHLAFAQQNKIDSFLTLLKKDKEDTSKVNHLYKLAFALQNTNPDSTIALAQQALALAQKINFKKGEANAYGTTGVGYWMKGDYPKSLENQLFALKIDEALGNKEGIVARLGNIGTVYFKQADYPKALDYYFKGLKMDEELGNKEGIEKFLGSIGVVYKKQGDYPKALDYYLKALKMSEEVGDKDGIEIDLGNIGVIYHRQADYPKALDYLFRALKMAEELGDKNGIARHLGNIGSVYQDQAEYPKALDYLFKALKLAEELGDKNDIAIHLGNIGEVYIETGKFKEAEVELIKAIALGDSIGAKYEVSHFEEYLSQLYDTTGRYKLALVHYQRAMVLKDTLFNQEKNQDITRKEMNYEFDKKEAAAKAEQDKKDAVARADLQKQKVQKYSFIGGAILLLVLALVLYNRYRLKQKANKTITKAFHDLKKTQTQLVQSEKMASVGQLTAGIAHEINNPINFVSANIAPLRRDVDEIMKLLEQYASLDKSNFHLKLDAILLYRDQIDLNYTIEEIKSLLNGIEEGSSRTASIVKGLRNFSRLDEDEKKKADINEGIESTLVLLQNKLELHKIEVLKSLGAISEIDCYPGQLNQVFLNLLTNSIDAIPGEGKIFVATTSENNHVRISIRDTGSGMSDEVKKKIFDPFFTTKEVGKGTGLGLSISYGIIEKHNGKIEVRSEVGKGTEFIISLPVAT